MFTVGKVMRSCWKSHVFKSWLENMTFSVWTNDFTHCVHQLSESPCHALFRTCLVFTVAITLKKISALTNIFFLKTALLGALVNVKPLWGAALHTLLILFYEMGFWLNNLKKALGSDNMFSVLRTPQLIWFWAPWLGQNL